MEKQAKSIKWFEMTDVISNVYGETTWTPLWRYDVLETGDSSTIGYEEEILRVRTLFAPLENKERLVRGHFLDFDPDGTYATIDCRNYCKPDVYYFDSNTGLSAAKNQELRIIHFINVSHFGKMKDRVSRILQAMKMCT